MIYLFITKIRSRFSATFKWNFSFFYLVWTRNYLILSRKNLVLTRKYLVLTRNYLVLTRNYLVRTRQLSRSNEELSRSNKKLSRSTDIFSRSNEKSSRSYEKKDKWSTHLSIALATWVRFPVVWYGLKRRVPAVIYHFQLTCHISIKVVWDMWIIYVIMLSKTRHNGELKVQSWAISRNHTTSIHSNI